MRAGSIGGLAGVIAVLVIAGAASADPNHVRTIATTRAPIRDVVADGRRLGWVSDGLYVFDRTFHRRAWLTRWPCGRGAGDFSGDQIALAGPRALFGCTSGSLSWVYGKVTTAAMNDRVARVVGEFAYNKDSFDDYERSFSYGAPVRIGSDGRTLVYFGSGYPSDYSSEPRRQGVWRLVGRRPVHIPYRPELLASIAVSRKRLATLAVEQTCACDRFPVFSADGREIAWNHGGTIWTMRSDGTSRRPVSSEGAADPFSAPRWSPTGSTLAFAAKDGITLVGADGSNAHRLVDGTAPSWSPDGTRLAFVRASDLWLIDADGTGERRLTSDGLGVTSRPNWSPDGASIAVSRAGGIWVVDVATGGARRIAPDPKYEDHDPVWSPDGSRLLFERRDSLGESQYVSALYVSDADGRNTHEVIRHSGPSDGEQSATWSPNGARVAFVAGSMYDESMAVVTVNADGTDRRRISGFARPGAPAWSPDGRTVVYGDDDLFESSSLYGGIFAAADGSQPKPTRLFPGYTTPLEVRNLVTGKLIRRWHVPAETTDHAALAFSGRYVVARVVNGQQAVFEPYDVDTGKRLEPFPVTFRRELSSLSLSGPLGVYEVDGRVVRIDLQTGRSSVVAKVSPGVAGPVIIGKRVFWAEPYRGGGRLRELLLP